MILRSGLEGTTQRRDGGSGLVGEVGGVDLSLEGVSTWVSRKLGGDGFEGLDWEVACFWVVLVAVPVSGRWGLDDAGRGAM